MTGYQKRQTQAEFRCGQIIATGIMGAGKLIKSLNRRVDMKVMSVIVVLGLLSVPAYAEEEAMATCEQYGELASIIMSNRQNGVAIGPMMKVAGDHPFVKEMVLNAYSSPLFRTKEHKDRAIAEFANDYIVECYKRS